MSEWMEIGVRSVVAILTLFGFTKVIGRKELAQMNIFDYVVGISIGSIGAQMAFDLSEDWYDFFIALVVYVGVHKLIGIMTMKSLWARKFFEGAPIVLVQEGKIIQKNLKRVHYNINTFLQECRLGGFFDIADVEVAILESSGRVSFIRKEKNKAKQEYLVANLIIDGVPMEQNLKALDKNIAWLEKQVKMKDTNIEAVLLATYNHRGEFNVYLKKADINVAHILQ